MFGFNRHNQPSTLKAAKTVSLVKDAAGAPAVSLEKIEQTAGIDLRKKSEAVAISLQKHNIAGIRAQVVVVLDHSGSMYSDYQNRKVQDLVERFLGFGLAVDIDGTVPVIPFDGVVHRPVEVTMENYHDVVQRDIWKPNDMGSTNLTAALKEVQNLAEKTDAPIFCAIVTDGAPNDEQSCTEMICKLAEYPVFVKFLAVRQVDYLEELDDLDDSQRLLDNVDTKEYYNLSQVSDQQFADDMADEWAAWTKAALEKGVLTQ